MSQFSVQFSDEMRKVVVSKMSEQWHCGEIVSGQRTDLKSISAYGGTVTGPSGNKHYSCHSSIGMLMTLRDIHLELENPKCVLSQNKI